MPSFTNAAYSILKEQGKPLSALEITDRALKRGLIATKGKHHIKRCGLAFIWEINVE
jgi:hypothetical protein